MISILNLGRCDYSTALRLQETLVDLRKQGTIPNVLLFVEHPPVITLGRNARESNIIASREQLAAHGVSVHEINRGGDVTFHGPGQLVAYPIFDLRSFEPKLGVIDYVRRLEEILMRICAQYTIETQRIAGMTGVWTYATPPPRLNGRVIGRDYTPFVESDVSNKTGGPHMPFSGICEDKASASSLQPTCSERKIAAIGVHISRGVTSHGFALNVTTELDFFNLIVPCGLTKPVTSIEYETGLRPSLDEVMTIASRTFGELWGSQMLWLESIHDLLPEGSPEAPPEDTPARAPENERRIASDDIHLA
ncbi:MAG TPA: lipoyl(octanoyl) transferase [Candidatus Saccharimonadales bacterium]|nr:lipoyl(octanoyl) transferase [Candidatus Saccharimonadales bacterium]